MKKQLKKSLSLFLAVLMMLSCWVWVAPQKAEAAGEVEAGKYYAKFVIGKIEEAGNSGNWAGNRLTINYQKHDGTTGTTTVSLDKSKYNTEGATNVTIWEGWLDGFPTYMGWYMKMEWKAAASVYLNADGCSFYVGKDAASCTNLVSNTDSFKWQNNAVGAGTKEGTLPLNAEADKYPSFQNITMELDPATHELAKVNTGIVSKSTLSVTEKTDTYGVKWTGPFNINYTLSSEGDVTITDAYASIEKSGETATVTIKPWFQTLYPGKQNAKIHIRWTATGGTSTKIGTENITVDFPTYTTTFHANGGRIGDDDATAEETIEYTGEKMNIGSVIGKAPAYAAKPGFEFKGFYSKQNDDATGLVASFGGTKFVDSGKENATTVLATHPDNVTPYNGDITYYAAWHASPLKINFVTQDGQLISEIVGRHNNYLTALNMYKSEANLNAILRNAYTGSNIDFNNDNQPIYTDGSTTYNFAGWKIVKAYDDSLMGKGLDTVLKGDVTFQAQYTKADTKMYTVSFEDGNGNVVSTKSDYKYRDDVTNVPATDPTKAQDDAYSYEFIGWAKDVGNNFYAVDENDNTEAGARIIYTPKDSVEFIVMEDASYVPVFRTTPRVYKVTYNYKVDNEISKSVVVDGYKWNSNPEMPEIKDNYTNAGYRYYIEGWKVGTELAKRQLDEITIKGDTTLTAIYGSGTLAEYTINFYGKDADGETDVLLNEKNNIFKHNAPVKAPVVPQTIDTEDSLYTFAGWSPEIKSPANGDADYYATYTRRDYADLHFYNYDGTLLYEIDGKENSLFVGEIIPKYENLVEKEDGTTENVLPTKAEDVVGTYNFTGWADGNGNKVVPGESTFTGDTYLTAQFETEYKEYTVKFVNDGKTVSEKKYLYGEKIELPADPTKEADVEYIYDFRAWSPAISEICYADATYEATYRRTAQVYTVTWLNDKKESYSESNYKYDAKIQQPVINEPVGDGYGEPITGKYWAFKHWVQCDENGRNIYDEENNLIIFARGQRMPAEHLYFYPVFEEVDEILTVRFYKEDGITLIGTAKVPYGSELEGYGEGFKELAPKESDSENHYIIENWVTVDGGKRVITVTEDTSVKATYTAEAHDKKLYEVVAEPTCNVRGYAHYKCEADECTSIDYNVVIAPITDEGDPTGQIYVGTNKWTLKDYEVGIEYGDIKFVGPNTHLIVNTKDTGTHNWSVEKGHYADAVDYENRGVGKIEYGVVNTYLEDPSRITKWTTIYDYEALRSEALSAILEENKITLLEYSGYNHGTVEDRIKKDKIDRAVDAYLSIYNANATGVVSNLNLENGKSYVIYIRVYDREGNGEVNTCVFSSGTINYGSEAAEIAVSGDGYGTKFCAEATVAVTDDTDGYTVYLDGEVVTLTDGKFTCDTAGVHTVTVVDKHGNKTTKTFEIKGNHTFRNYTTAATCENAGARYDLCTVCGHKANEVVIPALGHSYTANFIDKAPDCINDGYRTYVCDNNCGTKLVLKPTDDADTLAQAKKYVEPAEGEEGAWVALTADDLKELKATGKHTYAKVKDEDGNDTAEDAWVIDKAATCSVVGSKHKDCIVCGIEEARITEEIPLDTENGHKFYREKTTKEPTCTEKGEKTKTCRYCGEVVKTAEIDALGHVAGEYRVITDPACEDKGSKILTCGRCSTDESKVDIGEPIKDADGNITGFDGKAVEIPALGHAWKTDGKVYEEEGKYYHKYVCKNDSTHTKMEEVKDYQPPVAATVIFDFNGGSYVVPAVGNPNEFGYVPEMLKGTQTISTFVGESIIASDVETAIKQNNATKTYTFSHWATKNADGTYTEVKFPIEVKGDATYYAIYAEKYVNYTITYYKDGGTTEYKKTGYLHNGQEVILADGPEKAETSLVKYVFAGWKVVAGDTVYTDKVTIDGANVNLEATYTEVKKQYAVTYAYSSSNQIHTYTVEAGAKAPDARQDFDIQKNFDAKYHYTFKEWNRAAQLARVESNIYTTPNFDSAQHTYDHAGGKVIKSTATCTSAAVYTYTCTCGYTYEKVEGSALEHIWGDPVYNEATGKNTVTCQREGCGVTQTDTRSFKAEFFVNAEDTKAIKTVNYIKWGTTIEATKLPANPTKDSTATTDYAFKGWVIKGTTDIVDFTKLEIKDDYEFVAEFTETTREYNVIFAYDAHNIIKAYTKVKAGDRVELKLKDDETPVKAYDATYHYTFSNWQGYAEGMLNITVENVQSDLYILAEFSKAKHEYDNEEELNKATCMNGKGTRYSCDCGKYYDVTGKPLDHRFETYVLDEATGKLVSHCENKCGTTDVKEPEDNDGDNTGGNTGGSDTPTTPKKYTLTIHVYENGNSRAPIANAQVDIYRNSERVATDKTGPNGTVAFVVDEGTYGVDVSGIPYQGFYRTDVKVSGNTSFNANVYVKRCNCACHDTGLWGTIFRFFHKIIKMITGEFKCCKDPSNY